MEYLVYAAIALIAIPIGFFIPMFAVVPFVARSLKNKAFVETESHGVDDNAVVEEVVAKKGHDGFFTELPPGKVKVIERNGRFVECIMKYPGHTFRGKIEEDMQYNSREYWEVMRSKGSKEDADPIPKASLIPGHWLLYPLYPLVPWIFLWRLWQQWVYTVTGLVFTGIPPFQTVRTYPIEYFKEVTSTTGDFQLSRRKDFSDHFRVQDFTFFVPVDSADTSDKLSVRLYCGLIGRCFNPWSMAYDTDEDWTSRVFSVVPAAANNFTRSQTLDAVLSGSSEEGAKTDGLEKAILKIGTRINNPGEDSEVETGALPKFGYSLNEVSIPDRSPTDPEVTKKTARRSNC